MCDCRVLVTGAAGFVGSHLCEALLTDGCQVVGVDNFDPYYERAVKEIALTSLRRHPRFEFLESDVRTIDTVTDVLRSVDCVVHLAARPGVRDSLGDPIENASVNVLGTVAMLEACRRANVTRFVFTSSSSVYGSEATPPFVETAPCARPMSPYAGAKRASELECAVYAHLYGFRVAVLRLFLVYGPRQRPDLAIHRFTRDLAQGHPIRRFGDGKSERDYTHVRDVVAGIQLALGWSATAEPGSEIFNIGSGRAVRLERMIELIASALGVAPTIETADVSAADMQSTRADLQKSQRVLGYVPSISVEQGIPEFVDWYNGVNGSTA